MFHQRSVVSPANSLEWFSGFGQRRIEHEIERMATNRKLAELFRAIAAEDFSTATAIAAQVCKGEEQKGHRSAARLLRSALAANGRAGERDNGTAHTAINKTNGVLSTALVRLSNLRPLDQVVLNPTVRNELAIIQKEWHHRSKLKSLGLGRRTRLLFHGPPGCGKSLTARALGAELHLPTYLVRFDAVIGAFLGQTAGHLRQLFHFAEVTPCVLLLDELDALGKQRGNPLDVGELDRIVIALMQELEHSSPAGLIVATSNLARHLDLALWRRFDLALEFRAPSAATKRMFVKRLAKARGIKLPSKVVAQAVRANSFATAEAVVLSEARQQVLRSA